jgi:retinol-binding protein 3
VNTTAIATVTAQISLALALVLTQFVPLLAMQVPPERLDVMERTAIRDSLAAQLPRIYVFEERASLMTERLRVAFGDGSLEDAATPQALAQRLTQMLQEISEDRHLRLWAAAGSPAGATATEETMRAWARESRYGLPVDSILPGNVGYLQVKSFNYDPDLVRSEAAGHMATVMERLRDVRALIIDVRGNGGGHPVMAAVLSSYLFDDVPVHLTSLFWRTERRFDHFHTDPLVPGPKLGSGVPVYVLTDRATFSAAEGFAYNLQARGRVTVVGEPTGGGAHPGGVYRVGNTLMGFIPGGRAVNPVTGSNWEGAGVTPDLAVPATDALQAALERIRAEPRPGASIP